MNLSSVTLHLIESPLNTPFITHLEKVGKRQAIIIEIRDSDGAVGWGEADPFTSPWYTEETITTCWHALKDFLIPLILKHRLTTPIEAERLSKRVRGNQMARSGLSQALWDLYAREKEVSISHLFGATRKRVEAGAVIAEADPSRAARQIERLSAAGYKRYKIKISRENDLQMLVALRHHFPKAELMADANSAYSLKDLDHLKKMDEFHLQMIEQPFAWRDLVDHARLQQEIKTPICLDESIDSFAACRAALALNSCRVVNIKMARVGGWSEAVKIHDLCRQHGVPVWCGGMIEFGIGRAHSVALASLPGFTLPGDLFSSSRYWKQDIIEPEIQVKNGYISVSDKPGTGVDMNDEVLRKLTLKQLIIKKDAI
ncbi:o-succinylbenzoate synthase [Sporolactobacillus sp. Y61]|jgi:O-succinylbenzoate synthase|uniref:o-succinylbenzoate synthase n=1 Tax=Sporolactobacillus sp. Y61 TaxID=3160863 RepID=A0AAU8ICU3_9BACL